MNIFNVEYHAIIEIVKFDLGQVAQKWSSVSRIYEYQSTRSLLTLYMYCSVLESLLESATIVDIILILTCL